MIVWDNYLSRQKSYTVIPEEIPPENLSYAVVIPSFNEPALLETLDSLMTCKPPRNKVDVIVVVNHPEGSSLEIRNQSSRTMLDCLDWQKNHQNGFLKLIILDATDLPKKDAGAGLARKAGMDEAIRRFRKIERKDGVIISLDADTKVSDNYFTELECLVDNEARFDGCNFFFEHPTDEESGDQHIIQGIVQYELFLRYFLQFLREISFPFAFHAVGSAFAVSAEAYIRQGGMNKRKAGEDFYFLQKLIPHGAFYELNTATVYPSPRVSSRVPFGTGAAQTIFLSAGVVKAYHPDSFDELKVLITTVDELFYLKRGENPLSMLRPGCLGEFLMKQNFEGNLQEIISNSSGLGSFRKRFFMWFNAFRVFKFLNFAHLEHYAKIPVKDAAMLLLDRMGILDERNASDRALLEVFRKVQRETVWSVKF